MGDLHFLLPGDPATRTGGTLYDMRIIAGLRESGWHVQLHTLDRSFPVPTTQALAHAAGVLAGLADGALTVVDGLALGAMPELARREAGRLRLIALVHHPLALETGLGDSERSRLYASERAALAVCARVIVTSRTTARALADYAVPPTAIGVVEPGVDPAPLASGSNSATLALLCVATLTPRKGHAVLLEALGVLTDRSWRLDCVGSTEHHPPTRSALAAQVRRLGLTQRVAFHGEIQPASLAEYYRHADVFVLPSHYEGYGMALAEALAYGLPIVSTTAGAIPDTVPAAAGLLLPPGDIVTLAAALARIMDDRTLRKRLASGARAARALLPAWPVACARFAAELAMACGTKAPVNA